MNALTATLVRRNKAVDRALTSGPLAEGTTRAEVATVERLLRQAGFDPGTLDRAFDGDTAEAVRQFQRSVGLPATGELDERTFSRLKGVQKRIAVHGDEVVGVGQKGDRVRAVERRLGRLGYDVGNADGVYDAKTAAAVRSFRRDQDMKTRTGDVLGERGQSALRGEIRALDHDPFRSRVKPTQERKRLDARTATQAAREHADGTVGIGPGGDKRSVMNVQRHLRSAGFDPRRADGRWDERTTGMVKAFQERQGLEATGRVDARTWKELRKAWMYASGPASPAQDVGERSSAVKQTEKMLKALGYKTGKVDGVFDADTRKASRAFERKHDMDVDGAIGKNQLAAIKKDYQDQQGVSLSELRRIMPNLPADKARQYLPHLNKAMREFGITNDKRREQFLAQIAHESVELRYFEEIASGAAYEGRTDLGNTQPGDGVRYKGRGPIQLTGRANYRAAGRALGLPLEQHPEMASRPSVAFRIAGWFWKGRGLNALADRGDFMEITRRINGGYNGLESRRMYLRRAQRVID